MKKLKKLKKKKYLRVLVIYFYLLMKNFIQKNYTTRVIVFLFLRHIHFFSYIYTRTHQKINSLLAVTKFGQLSLYPFLRQVKRRFQKGGLDYAGNSFENFLCFLKMEYNVDPTIFIYLRLLLTIWLPFKLYRVKRSNRNYFFPGPMISLHQHLGLIFSFLAQALRRRREFTYTERFFNEVLSFFSKQPDSFLGDILNNYLNQGFENRAFIHYRWMLKK